MKVNYNGFRPMTVCLDDARPLGTCFEYETHYYMRIRIDCANIKVEHHPNFIPVVNIHSGTIRMLDKSTCVWPLQAKCSLRQGHTHEEVG